MQVLEGAVRVLPSGAAADGARQVPAGMRLSFGDGIGAGLEPVSGDPSAWQRGMLQVDGMPLRTFLAELQRYRSGWIDCAPEVAHLPISGAFPLDDPDRVLATVADTLPPVSYTHLDVYKRQGVEPVHQAMDIVLADRGVGQVGGRGGHDGGEEKDPSHCPRAGRPRR